MPASVADTWQTVVLGTDGEMEGTTSGACGKGRGQVTNSRIDLKSRLGKGLRQPGAGAFFLISEFGMSMNVAS